MKDHSVIPKCIINAFLVGYYPFANKTEQKRKFFIRWLMQNEFVKKEGSAGAIYQVGSTTGRTFGLLDQNNYPTKLFSQYFELK